MEKNEREKRREKKSAWSAHGRKEGRGEKHKAATERRGKKKWRAGGGWSARVNKKEGTRNEKSEKRMRTVDARLHREQLLDAMSPH